MRYLMPPPSALRLATIVSLSLGLLVANTQAAESDAFQWRQSDKSVALVKGDQVVWQFNHGDDLTKPYFHPVTAAGQALTWDRPADHVWHHGLWFSWKYINRLNYWEPNGETGKPDGTTEWRSTEIETGEDHSARISMRLDYHPANEKEVVLTERRVIDVAPPASDGVVTIDWKSEFTALQDALLDRTPVGDKPWGGYAGLSVRFAKNLEERGAVGPEGPLTFGADSRHRSHQDAVDYHGVINGQPVGLAILDHASNPRHPTKWYVIRSPVMSYMNAALLHDEPLELKRGEKLSLRYRLIAHPELWDAARLKEANNSYQIQ